MKTLNTLFFEDNNACMFVAGIEAMNDLDDYMCGFHRISLSMTEERLDDKKVLKVCFGDLLDETKLRTALKIYFRD